MLREWQGRIKRLFGHCQSESCLQFSELQFNVHFQYKYGYIRDKRSGVKSYPYPVKED